MPPCSRCAGALASVVQMPQHGEDGQPIVLEPCPACDAGAEAAGALLCRPAGGGTGSSRDREGSRLVTAWLKEAMAARGWIWRPRPMTVDQLPHYTGPRPLGAG
ncbi:DUF6300 family protein [Streptomyces sp. DH37]|nr:DUF6300 family protein [Streptomyces sp. DH37]MDG9703311.1 DUF6300 family protein [Streptomyces sp. DH37]